MSYCFAGQAPVFLLTSWQKAGAFTFRKELEDETEKTDCRTDSVD